MLSIEQSDIEYHFFIVFGMTRFEIERRSPKPLANTLLIRPMAWFQNNKPSLCSQVMDRNVKSNRWKSEKKWPNNCDYIGGNKLRNTHI